MYCQRAVLNCTLVASRLSAGQDLQGAQTMSNKEQHGNKETKKKPVMTPKEKKAAKKAKKAAKG